MNTLVTPEGYSTVCPYLMVDSIERQIQFLMHVFQAEVIEELINPEGTIMHGEVQIGNTVIMMGKSRSGHPSLEGMNYIFAEDVDQTYKLALAQGAESLMEPGDQFYGMREAGFRDPLGNQWWVARQIEKLSQEEIQQRMDELSER